MRLLLLTCIFLLFSKSATAQSDKPVNIGVVGLTHSHVHWIFGREDRGDIEVVGIVEPNQELALRFSKQYSFPMSLVYPTMEAMIEAVEVEAVTAFGSIYEHLAVVQTFAPLGIHVMA